MKRTILYISAIFLVVLSSCELEPEEYGYSKGSADFSTTIFMGNSLTSGFRDGDLFLSGQEESFPSMIAHQLKSAGYIKEFKQPIMPNEFGFGNRLELGSSTDCNGVVSLGPIPYHEDVMISQSLTSIADDGPFQNLGVPGAEVQHLLYSGYDALNPYYERWVSAPNVPIIQEATSQEPTFVVMWIGNNDVLGYAMSGGASDEDTITSQSNFAGAYSLIMQQLDLTATGGVLLNIPDVTSTAFFTTVPYNALDIDEETAIALNAGYADYNAGASSLGLPGMSFGEGKNALVIADDNPIYEAVGGIRQIKEGELVLLTVPQDSIKCHYWGSMVPIPDKYVLTEDEMANIQVATEAFNSTISSMAQQYGWGLADVNEMLNDIAANGLRIGGQSFSTTFVSGNLFSLDGIHLTGKGYAIVANKIIGTINSKYGANLPQVNVNDYSGNVYP